MYVTGSSLLNSAKYLVDVLTGSFAPFLDQVKFGAGAALDLKIGLNLVL